MSKRDDSQQGSKRAKKSKSCGRSAHPACYPQWETWLRRVLQSELCARFRRGARGCVRQRVCVVAQNVYLFEADERDQTPRVVSLSAPYSLLVQVAEYHCATRQKPTMLENLRRVDSDGMDGACAQSTDSDSRYCEHGSSEMGVIRLLLLQQECGSSLKLLDLYSPGVVLVFRIDRLPIFLVVTQPSTLRNLLSVQFASDVSRARCFATVLDLVLPSNPGLGF
ncbi:uncharacterized protein UTRI_00465 [Ustilago trichophora]|uniref:Uncharacterized protein n=1 Tax=Ustilago trichophora TaxID=86804 RepID=A0A5C3DRQ2_9BASI|nr:uncharacterized protein UTRI_00465 [Ustilago trichophora]